MATEIMRPHTVSLSGKAMCVPETSDAASLINDVVADDDATYINITQTGATNYCSCKLFSDKAKNEYQNIINAIVVIRMKNGNLNHVVTYRKFNDAMTFTDTTIASSITNQWETIVAPIDLDDIKSVIAYGDSTRILVFQNGSSSKATCDVKISQFYLEVTYAGGETETIYLKQNNTWTEIPCTIYQKQNNEWVLTDSSILNDGDRFAIQEIS